MRPLYLRSIKLIFSTFLLFSVPLQAQSTGTITGKVFDKATKEPLPFTNVVVKGTPLGATTDYKGNFVIEKVPAGTYTLVVSLIGYTNQEIEGVSVQVGELVQASISLSSAPIQLAEVKVYGASLRKERITEAPAAVTVLEAKDFKLSGGQNQLPKLLETEPGVDIAQSGLYDFNVNTRGFNSSLNRRLQVLLDGRDLAIAFLSAQEWNGMSVPVEDLGRMELIRGPSSALYGANAFNGVINIQTPRPKEIVGTKISLAGGERQMLRFDARQANVVGLWGYRVNVGRVQGESWSVNRKGLQWAEYEGGFDIRNNEEAELGNNKVASTYGSGRVDYDFEDGGSSTLEAGITQVENEVYVTGIGRVQVPKALKPWARINYSNSALFVQFWGAARDSREPQISLSSGLPLIERSFIGQGEVQYRTSVLEEKVFLVSGFSFRYQTINTERTLMLDARNDNATGIYAQAEYLPLEHLKLVGAARWDRSTLHESQLSPKLAAVWTPVANHSFRATYNEAFQSPNLSELFLRILRTATSPYNPTLKSYSAFLGNSDLKVEKIRGYELGYKGIVNNSLFITIDGYYNILRDFNSDLTPIAAGVAIPGDTVKDNLGQLVTRTVWSYRNAGKVEERGFEIGLNYYLSDEWLLSGNYAYFDHDLIDTGTVSLNNFVPNAPRHKLNGGFTYTSHFGIEIGVRIKYVPSFDWAAGIYQGRILAYTLVDLAARYQINSILGVGFNVSNLLDRRHYQIFGGSLLGRRAIVSLTATF